MVGFRVLEHVQGRERARAGDWLGEATRGPGREGVALASGGEGSELSLAGLRKGERRVEERGGRGLASGPGVTWLTP